MPINNFFTECENGTYGINCSQKCPEGCNLGTCDIYTGACKKGCKSSYILPDCLQSKIIKSNQND